MAWLSEKQLAGFKRVGRGVKISDQALIYGAQNIEVGDNVRIDAQTIILASNGSLKIGSHVHIAVQCLLSANGGIVLGDFSDVSPGAKLISASDNPSGEYLVGPVHPEYLTQVRKATILVDHYAWVGTNCVLLPGAIMRQGSMLGVGSVMNAGQVLEHWKIYVGHPAIFYKDRKQTMVEKSREAMKAWDESLLD